MSSAQQCTAAVAHTLRNSKSAVQSVAKVEGGGWVVKVSQSSEGLVNRLRATFPLATVALSEDLVGGAASAHVLFPPEGEQRILASELARSTRVSRLLRMLSQFFFYLAALVFVASIAAATRRSP